ncbi:MULTISPECIES: hypothetical protein [Cupriavidus]
MQLNSFQRGAKRTGKSKSQQPKTIVMRFEQLATNPNGPSYFHGFDVGTNEPVAVRLNTVEEGLAVVGQIAVNDRAAAEKMLKDQYIGTGEKRRPRPGEFVTAGNKVECKPGGMIAFTRCLPNADGSFRAHWPDTIARDPGAACELVHANVMADQYKDGDKVSWVVAADVVDPKQAVVLDAGNAVPSLMAALAPQTVIDGEPIGRRPFAYLRLRSKDNGTQPLDPVRINPAFVRNERVDHDGGGGTIVRHDVAPAEDSLKRLMQPGDDVKINSDMLAAKAMIFALSNEPGYPEFKGASEDNVADLRNIINAVREGSYAVELIPGERISAGPATRASILKSAFDESGSPKMKVPVHMFYSPRDERGYVKERRFVPTYLTTEIGKDGMRFFTKFLSQDHLPPKTVMKTVATENKFDTENTAEMDGNDGVDLADDAAGFDPSMMDAQAAASVDGKLASASAALDEMSM